MEFGRSRFIRGPVSQESFIYDIMVISSISPFGPWACTGM
jgi:hypothetical protein